MIIPPQFFVASRYYRVHGSRTLVGRARGREVLGVGGTLRAACWAAVDMKRGRTRLPDNYENIHLGIGAFPWRSLTKVPVYVPNLYVPSHRLNYDNFHG